MVADQSAEQPLTGRDCIKGQLQIAAFAEIARNRRDRKNQIPAMSAIPGDCGDLL
jgi:hypothetical protein